MTNLEIIRQACINSNLSKFYNRGDYSQIHLSDILIASSKLIIKDLAIRDDGMFVLGNDLDYFTDIFWDFTRDSIDKQQPETIIFLAKLFQ